MKIFTSKKEISAFLLALKEQEKTIGLVPTMGALHQGHLSLIERAKTLTDIVVCSIFVNPTQFNDPSDLEKYPRPVDSDIAKLTEAKCDILFMPAVDEMYAANEQWYIELGEIENVLEGEFRPNHYQGVTQIVKKLFDITTPDKAFFGQKDFQQFKIIEKLVELFNIPVELHMCPIVREENGLAMSSRNIHLSEVEKVHALALINVLTRTRLNFNSKPLKQLKHEAIEELRNSEGVQLEYFEICDARDLRPTESKETANIVALVAAFVGKTRLIDNLILK